MSAEESRTYELDRQLVEDLASPDHSVLARALEQLPDGLSRKEVSDIGLQVSLFPGPEAIRQGERLEERIIVLLGYSALLKHEDLVTATSASKVLLSRGQIAGWFMLSKRTRKAKKQILKDMQNLDPEM